MKKMLLICLFLLVFAVNLSAEDVLHYVPKDVAVFVHWRSGEVMGDVFKESNLGRISKHPDYDNSLSEIVNTIKIMSTEPDGFTGFGWLHLLLVELQRMGEGELILYIRALDEEELLQSNLRLQIGIICKGDDGMKRMRSFLKNFAANSDMPVRLTESGDICGVLLGGSPESTLHWRSDEECVKSNILHQVIYESNEVQVMIAGFVNTMGLMNAMFDAGFISRDDAMSMKELGLWGVKGIVFSEGLNNGLWDSSGLVITTNEREGVLEILDGHQELNEDMLKVVPSDAVFVNAVRQNISDYFPKMIKFLNCLDETMTSEIIIGMALMSKAYQVDMVKDVIVQFQDGYVTYYDRQKGYDSGNGLCIISKLHDPVSAIKTAEKIIRNISIFDIKMDQWENEDGLFCEIDNIIISITHGYLAIAYDRGVMDRAIKQLKNPATSILDNERFIESRSYFGDSVHDSFGTALTYTDLEATAPEFEIYYQKTDRAASKIRTPYRRVARYLDHMGSTVRFDDRTVQWSVVSPYPFAYLYSPMSQDAIGFMSIDTARDIFQKSFNAGNATGRRMKREQKTRREFEKAAEEH